MDASFTFTDPNDVSRVDEVIGEYQSLIAQEKIKEIDGIFPPDEDMEKLNMFRTVIHPLVVMVRNAGTGTAWISGHARVSGHAYRRSTL